jgi:hypothetical protein
MGKKFVPVAMGGYLYKVYLDDIHKIYKKIEKTEKPIPPFRSSNLMRKQSQETQPDTEEHQI